MALAPVHVAYHNPFWVVTVEREQLPRSQHRVKEVAVDAARALAVLTQSDLVIHAYGGDIEHRESYRSRFLQ